MLVTIPIYWGSTIYSKIHTKSCVNEINVCNCIVRSPHNSLPMSNDGARKLGARHEHAFVAGEFAHNTLCCSWWWRRWFASGAAFHGTLHLSHSNSHSPIVYSYSVALYRSASVFRLRVFFFGSIFLTLKFICTQTPIAHNTGCRPVCLACCQLERQTKKYRIIKT